MPIPIPYVSSDIEPNQGAMTEPGGPLPGSMDCPAEPDVVRRDRFELLSAYLDGEVTAQDRALVEHWLNTDSSAKCLYHRLLCLRQGCQELCLQDAPGRVTVSQVLQRLRYRLGTITMATAGILVLATLNLLSGEVDLSSRVEHRLPTGRVLEVTLDQPVFPIPKLQKTSSPHLPTGKPSHNPSADSQLEPVR
jgi:hypothetical protein